RRGSAREKETTMLISSKLEEALNRQVGREMGASLQYLAIAAHFDRLTLKQLARFFYRQSDEERGHALKFARHLVDAGASVALGAIPAARGEFASAEEAVALSLAAEEEVTRQIASLMEQAIQSQDHVSQEFLRWFVSEQLEEVRTMEELLTVVRRAGPDGLLLVEEYLARQPAPHAEEGA
ncbi:MAG: ferritin, partial [Anaerolineales bacterium]